MTGRSTSTASVARTRGSPPAATTASSTSSSIARANACRSSGESTSESRDFGRSVEKGTMTSIASDGALRTGIPARRCRR
ncbi:putative signal peptide protein [Halorubrum sp. AJ67]|nr:putative signal peptide protein [Halorubrum sp. AJ67]